MFNTRDAYLTAKRCGTYRKLYDAAADPAEPEHDNAKATLALMASDARGESNGFGARACVHAAITGGPYAIAYDGGNEHVWN